MAAPPLRIAKRSTWLGTIMVRAILALADQADAGIEVECAEDLLIRQAVAQDDMPCRGTWCAPRPLGP